MESHSHNKVSIHVFFDASAALTEEMVYKLSLLAPLDHVTHTSLSCLLVSANSEANHGSYNVPHIYGLGFQCLAVFRGSRTRV